MEHQIITRKQAHAEGRQRFFTGRPCKHGHVAQRFVTTGGCVKCNAERSKLFALDMRTTRIAAQCGHFIYPLHPDDHAAALAYCQALDLGRGRVPHVPSSPSVQPAQTVTPAVAAAVAYCQTRVSEHLASLATPDDEPYLPKP